MLLRSSEKKMGRPVKKGAWVQGEQNSNDCLVGNMLLAPEEMVTYTPWQLVSQPDLSAVGWSGDETIQLQGLTYTEDSLGAV